jgi:hypothetical protein
MSQSIPKEKVLLKIKHTPKLNRQKNRLLIRGQTLGAFSSDFSFVQPPRYHINKQEQKSWIEFYLCTQPQNQKI